MKRMFKRICLLVFILYVVFISCKPIKYGPSGTADALIISMATDSGTVFGLGLHAYAFGEFSSVTAFNTNNPSKIYTLVPFNEAKNDLSYETPLNEMTHELPPVGEYTFSASFPDDEFLTFYDYLTSDYVSPPPITECEYDSNQDKVIVSWGTFDNGEVLNVKLYDLQKKLLFASPTLDKSVVIYTFNKSDAGWLTTSRPVAGQQYSVVISLFLLEPLNGGSLNIQASSQVEKTITWGN